MIDLPDFGPAIRTLGIVLAISIPLGLWKLVDIVLFVASHLHWR